MLFLSKNMVSTLGFHMPNLFNFSTGFQNMTLTKRFALCGVLLTPFRNIPAFLSIVVYFFLHKFLDSLPM